MNLFSYKAVLNAIIRLAQYQMAYHKLANTKYSYNYKYLFLFRLITIIHVETFLVACAFR